MPLAHPLSMTDTDDISPLDPIELTEQAIRCLREGNLEDAARYLKVAKYQITDKLVEGDPLPLRRISSKDVIKH